MQPTPKTRNQSELESTVTLADFVRTWSRCWIPFLIGLALVAIIAAAWAKTQTPCYRARASFFVTSNAPVSDETRSGRGWQNEEVHAAFLTNLAEQYLQSNNLLLEAARKSGMTQLYEQFGIEEQSPDQNSRLMLAGALKSRLSVRDIEKSGIMIAEFELPAPALAASFVNDCLAVLDAELKGNAVAKVTVIESATPPLSPSRPRLGMSVALAAALYTFVFMLALILTGLIKSARPEARFRD